MEVRKLFFIEQLYDQIPPQINIQQSLTITKLVVQRRTFLYEQRIFNKDFQYFQGKIHSLSENSIFFQANTQKNPLQYELLSLFHSFVGNYQQILKNCYSQLQLWLQLQYNMIGYITSLLQTSFIVGIFSKRKFVTQFLIYQFLHVYSCILGKEHSSHLFCTFSNFCRRIIKFICVNIYNLHSLPLSVFHERESTCQFVRSTKNYLAMRILINILTISRKKIISKPNLNLASDQIVDLQMSQQKLFTCYNISLSRYFQRLNKYSHGQVIFMLQIDK
eukprot:TRINITY_DN11804_c0_g2_i2.p1 TRINITY_DN11804_c0_g2~~TRINITY_DN11804_c0_g2_i2.p1  ORF type:complete len:276 (-),score=-31.57 TRINITY_DN11804_c0_g2_i2:464-1291(-)